MRITLILAISLLISCLATSQDIKNVFWGMNQQQVRSLETSELFNSICPSNDYCILMYKDFIFGDTALIMYDFYSDSLRLYTYHVPPIITYGIEYTFYLKYLNMLKALYKEPDYIVWQWNKESFKYNLEEHPEDGDFLFNFYFVTGELKNVIYLWRLPNMIIELKATLFIQNDGKKMPAITIKYCSY